MLLLFELVAEKNDAHKEKINGTANSNMVFDVIPGLFHLAAPVYIIKNKNGITV